MRVWPFVPSSPRLTANRWPLKVAVSSGEDSRAWADDRAQRDLVEPIEAVFVGGAEAIEGQAAARHRHLRERQRVAGVVADGSRHRARGLQLHVDHRRHVDRGQGAGGRAQEAGLGLRGDREVPDPGAEDAIGPVFVGEVGEEGVAVSFLVGLGHEDVRERHGRGPVEQRDRPADGRQREHEIEDDDLALAGEGSLRLLTEAEVRSIGADGEALLAGDDVRELIEAGSIRVLGTQLAAGRVVDLDVRPAHRGDPVGGEHRAFDGPGEGGEQEVDDDGLALAGERSRSLHREAEVGRIGADGEAQLAGDDVRELIEAGSIGVLSTQPLAAGPVVDLDVRPAHRSGPVGGEHRALDGPGEGGGDGDRR